MRSRLPLLIVATLAALARVAAGQCPDDAFEDNDSILAAVPIAPGSYPGLILHNASASPCGIDEDFYRVPLPGGMALRVELSFTHTDGNLGVFLYDDPADFPNGWVARSTTLTDDEAVVFANTGGTALEVYVFVDGANAFETQVYDLTVAVEADPCQGLAPDAFEPNDACAASAPVTPGVHAGLVVSDASRDYYSIDVPDGQAIAIDLAFLHDAAADVNATLLDGCGQPLRSAVSQTDDERLVWANSTGVTQGLNLHVFVNTGSSGVCVPYDMQIALSPDPCATFVDDPFEDNDDCRNPLPLVPGTYASMKVAALDRDAFVISVPPGETLTVALIFSHDDGDVDMHMFQQGLFCTHVEVAESTSADDDELIVVTNGVTVAQEFLWEVFVSNNAITGSFDCNEYTMIVDVSGHDAGQGFCFGTDLACPCANGGSPGSGCDSSFATGGGELSASGNTSVSFDTLALHAAALPPATTALFFQGDSAAGGGTGVPFGDGLLCAEGGVVRLGAGTTTAGAIDFGFGFTGGNPISVRGGVPAAGGTRRYQVWYRNQAPAFCTPARFNTSNGWELVWAP